MLECLSFLSLTFVVLAVIIDAFLIVCQFILFVLSRSTPFLSGSFHCHPGCFEELVVVVVFRFVSVPSFAIVMVLVLDLFLVDNSILQLLLQKVPLRLGFIISVVSNFLCSILVIV